MESDESGIVNPNPAPGAPHRQWDDEELSEFYAKDAELLLMEAGASDALKRLVDDPAGITDTDLIAFGKLNSVAYLKGYEPLVMLYGRPVLHSRIENLLREFTEFFVRP